MTEEIYSFEFEERIPEKEIKNIILITKSGFSYNGKHTTLNNNILENFSILNVPIFLTLFIYYPIFVYLQQYIKHPYDIFKIPFNFFISIIPEDEIVSHYSILSTIYIGLFFSFAIIAILLYVGITFLYYHIKIIHKLSNYVNKKMVI